MRCHICDNLLAPEEIRLAEGHFEPCRTCVEEAFDPEAFDDENFLNDDDFPGC